MDDWFVTVLISVRDMAAKNGMVALAEEMDIAILVASNESHEREIADLGTVDVRPTERNTGTAGHDTRSRRLRRYH
mgnify:CR=1 FL=1